MQKYLDKLGMIRKPLMLQGVEHKKAIYLCLPHVLFIPLMPRGDPKVLPYSVFCLCTLLSSSICLCYDCRTGI